MSVRGVAGSALAVTALLGGCNGSETTESRFTTADLQTLVAVSPDATGWTWSAKPTTRLVSPVALAQADLPLELGKEIARAGLERTGRSHWQDKGKQAWSIASIYKTSEGARAVFAAERTLAQASFLNAGGHQVDVDVGDESWAVRGGSKIVGFVEIGWTRGNAVLNVSVECTPCTSDVAAAAEAWAAAIDDAAQAASTTHRRRASRLDAASIPRATAVAGSGIGQAAAPGPTSAVAAKERVRGARPWR